MNKVYEKLMKAYESIEDRIPFEPAVALVLGSGLGAYADKVEPECIIEYSKIVGFPVSTVFGHKGRFIFTHIGEVPAVIMQGRVHYYEGYSITDVVMPMRLMKLMGAKVLFLTNASGGINESFTTGDFMLMTDHISSFVVNPLIGSNIDELGVRFPDMSEVYRKDLNQIIRDTAKDLRITLREGVYVQATGPSYESAAEIRMFRMMGADAVGMSTVCEAIAANHMGMKVCAISCITNMACGILDQPLSHEEVFAAGKQAAPKFEKLVTQAIMNIWRNENEHKNI